jgi:hypothetical protein
MGEPGTFIKFGKYEHLLQLQNEGHLHLNTPRYFSEIEDRELRGDPFECIASAARGSRVELTLEGQRIVMEGEWVLRMYPLQFENLNIFCMYALRPLVEGTFPIDQRNFLFGDHALVLLDPDEFMSRMGTALKSQKIKANGDLVEYIHDNYVGEIGPFRKRKTFAYQSEWRLVCSDGPAGPREINIGTLRDISEIVPSRQVNETIKVTFEQDAT